METDGRRMCGVVVGLGDVDLVGIEELAGDRLRVTIRSRPLACCARGTAEDARAMPSQRFQGPRRRQYDNG